MSTKLQASYAELQQKFLERTRVLATLLEVSRTMTSVLELEPLLGLILDQLKSVVDYDGTSILQFDGKEFQILAYRGPIPSEEALQFHFPLQEAGVNRQVIQDKAPVIIPDVRGDTSLAHAFQHMAGDRLETTFAYIRSWMGVPLIAKDLAIGMLTLDHRSPNYYTTDHAALVMAFANQAAVALENARLLAKAERRMQELEALYRADEELLRKLALDEVLQALVDMAVDILDADKSSLLVWDAQREKLVVGAACGFSSDTMARMVFEHGEGIVGQVAMSGQPCVVEDTELESGVARRITRPEGIRAFIHVPVKIGGQVFGVFNASYLQPRTFGNEELRLFTALAQRAALAIENAQLYQQAQQAAVWEERQRLARELHDAVTQTLFSASLIAEVLPRLWERDIEMGKQRLQELRELTRGALAEMRTLLMELRPSAVAEAEFDDLLRQLATAFTGRARTTIELKIEGKCTLPSDVKIGLYRITQEALNNVFKHAHASHVTLQMDCQAEGLRLVIRDDGRGFNPDDVPPDRLGLGIMRERAEAIDADLHIESQPDHGTRISVVWTDHHPPDKQA